MRRIAILLFPIALLGVIILFSPGKKSVYNEIREQGGDFPALRKFETAQRYDENSFLAFAPNAAEKAKVNIFPDVSRDEAVALVDEQATILRELFDPARPPYPEFLTKETGCDAKFLPGERETTYGRYFLVYAGERMGYGICADDLVAHRAVLGFFYCPAAQKLFKVEYFGDKNADDASLEEVANGFRCIGN